MWPSTVIVAGADATQVNGPFYRSASQQRWVPPSPRPLLRSAVPPAHPPPLCPSLPSGGAPKYVSSSGGDYEIFRFRVKAASGHAHWRWFIGCPAAKEVLYFCVEPPMAAQDGELPPHNGWRVHPAVAGRVKSAPTLRPAIDGPAESPQSSEPSPPQRAGPAASQSSRATEGKGPAAQARAAGPHQPQLRGEYVQAVGDGESTSTGSTASTASGSDEEDEEEEREGGGPDSGASEEGGEGDAVARPREPGPGSGRDGGAARTTDAQALAALARRVQHRRSLHRAPTPSKPAAHAHRSRPPSPASEAGRGASQASAEDERRGRRIEAALGRVFAEGEPRSGRPLFQAPVLEPSAVCKDGDASRCPLLPHVARALDDHGALASLQALFAVRHGKRTQVAKLGRDRCRLTCVRAHDAALGAFAARRRVLLDQLAAVGLTPATAAVAAAADASRRRRTTSSSSLASRRKDLLLSWRRLDAKSQEASSAQPSRSVNGQEGRRREGKGDGRRPPLRRGRRGRSDHRPEDWGNGSDSDIAAHAAQALARSFAPAEPARSRQGSAGSVGDSPVDEGWGNGVSEGMEGDSARSASVGGPLQQEQRRLQQQGSSGDLASLREGMQPAAERQRASSVNSGLAPPPRLVVMPTPAAATLPAAGSGGNCATAAVEAQEAGSDEAVDASGVVHFSAELAQSEQRSDTHGTDKHVVYAIDVAFPVAAPCAEWAVGLSADGGGETALAGAAGGESDGEKREASSSAANSNTPALARASAVLAEELRGWRVYRRYGRFKALHQHLLFAQREEAESGNGGFDLPPLPAAKGMKRLFRARPGDEHKEEALAEYLRSAVALQAASARARAAVALFLLPDPAVDACAVEQEAVVVARPRSAGHDPVSPTLDARPPQRQPPPGATLQDVQERAVAELGSPAFADAVEGDAAAVARLVWRLLRDQASRLLRGTHMALTLEGARSALSDRASFPRALAPARPAAPLRMDLLVHQPDNEVQGLAPDAIVALQGGKCAGCCGPIQRSSLWSSCIRCRYTGHCFCTACHKERLHPLPWRVLHRWDFTPHKVRGAGVGSVRFHACHLDALPRALLDRSPRSQNPLTSSCARCGACPPCLSRRLPPTCGGASRRWRAAASCARPSCGCTPSATFAARTRPSSTPSPSPLSTCGAGWSTTR